MHWSSLSWLCIVARCRSMRTVRAGEAGDGMNMGGKNQVVKVDQPVGHLRALCPPLMATLVLSEIGTDKACYRDMSSFPETKAEKYANRSKGKKFLQYNRRQLSRIYPKGQRMDSSNYDPLPMWICGSQLVALNFQTPGKSCFWGCCWAHPNRLPQKSLSLMALSWVLLLEVVWVMSPTSVLILLGTSP